jgi:hypothetical protein
VTLYVVPAIVTLHEVPTFASFGSADTDKYKDYARLRVPPSS